MLNLCSAMYIIAWTTLPFMSIGTIYRLIAALATVVWCLTIRQINPQTYKKAQNVIIIGAFYCILTFVNTYLLYGNIGKAISDTINPFVVVIIFMFCYGYYGTSYFKKIVYFTLICFAIVGAVTLYQLYLDPRAARDAYFTWMEGDNSAYTTIGTYGFIMSSALACLPLFVVIIAKNIQTKTKLFFAVVLAVLFMMVLRAGYTIAIFATMIAFIVFVCVHKTSIRKKLFIILICVILLFVWKDLLEWTLEFLIDVTKDNIVYNERMKELYNSFILGLETSGDLAAREKRYTATIREIIRNPIFGAAVWKGKYNGGGHSEYLDAIGKFGVIYFGCSIWITLIKPIKNILNNKTKAMCWGVGVGLFLLCVLDTYSYVQMLITALVMPYVAYLLTQEAQIQTSADKFS